MKQVILTLGALLLLTVNSIGQDSTEKPPYLKYPTLPTIEMVKLDSSGTFSTYEVKEGKVTILMFFSPDCDHCEMLTGKLKEHMSELKKTNIYMMTPLYLPVLNDFYNRMELSKYKNIKVGKDHTFFFPRFYQVSNVPHLAVYDKKKKFVASIPGDTPIEKILETIKKAQ